jgi:acetylornithine deacetylase/succinyl-diaminopimelate desuccinylase-like protein
MLTLRVVDESGRQPVACVHAAARFSRHKNGTAQERNEETMSQLENVLKRIDDDLDAAIERLFAVLRIKSISTDPAYKKDVAACADWHVADLEGIGFKAKAHATPGHPIVVAHHRLGAGPSALFYGHYDVQPVDPLALWDRDPFEPAIETRPDGTKLIRARGAADDKGQLMTFVEACRAWKAVTGSLPIAVTILLEGEEETGGVNLPPFMKAHAEELRADIGLICDTNMWNATTPAIVTMLRGMVTEEVIIHAADRDLHSGFYGSAAANPNRILARILADLHDEQGRVTLPGFYDGVPELPESLRAQWDSLGFEPKEFLGAIGLGVPAGERDRTVLEMVWSRPTCEINGMGGGYQGDGFKTVIPAVASAKVSFRLVFDQDPHKVREAFRAFVAARVPADCRVEFIGYGAGRAIRFPDDAPAFAKVRQALTDEWGTEAKFIGSGGSIPVNSEIKNVLGMDVILAGFGLDDDRIHSPNEKYELASFHHGIRSWARILAALAR